MDETNLAKAVALTLAAEEGALQFASGAERLTGRLISNDGSRWMIALLSEQASQVAHLKRFEAGMQQLIEQAQVIQGDAGGRLALAIAFDSTLTGERNSYRRALKKYSNSIVFEDVGIHLLLISQRRGSELVKPNEVNVYLAELDEHIARGRRRA